MQSSVYKHRWVTDTLRSPRALAVLAMTVSMPSVAAEISSTPPGSNRGIEEVTVAATPLGGLELPLDRIPGNIQQATAEDIERAHQVGLAQFLDRRLGSVYINEAQSNPLQPDVQFRGFVASPLLGQPQGIAVYLDGVRINDPFGDIVNWALIPESAIASVDVIPGSNPVFGLNALGGAISLRTKNGDTDPGTQAEVMGGSSGRVVTTLESGGRTDKAFGMDHLSYYGSARYLDEHGWREHSPSNALHLFGNLRGQRGASSMGLSVSRIETDLIGNGPAPIQLLEIERDAIYTYPDRTQNSLTAVTLNFTHKFAADVQLESVAYLRRSNIDSLNGDESDFQACESNPALVCNTHDEPAFGMGGARILFSDDLDGATLNRGSTRQDSHGVSMQLGVTESVAGHENRLIVGGSIDRSSVRFGSGTELGRFDAERGAIGGGAFVEQSSVDLHSRTENVSVFLTNTFAVAPNLDLTASGRYNDNRIELRDQLGTALTGNHDFARFNGAAGITYRVTPALRFYASYSESNRAPSPVELTCASEADPCPLPNAFLADPPLQQVIAKTIEGGARGTWNDMRWHAGLFRANNTDDILFISAGALTNRGFFDNVGDTRRQGVELNFEGDSFDKRLHWFAHYTRLQAQFRQAFRVSSPHNPSAIDGETAVRRGARIPGTPEHIAAAGMSVTVVDGLTIGLDMKYQSSQFFRGDEANLNRPLPGYTTVNAGAEWQVASNVRLFAQVDNLFDKNYATFGLYGAADEVLGEEFDDPRFVSPGAPRSAWIGVRWNL